MQLKRIKVTLADKSDFSAMSKEETEKALTELERECINRIVNGIIAARLIKFDLVETAEHGFIASASLGIYDIGQMGAAPESKTSGTMTRKKIKS